MAITRMGTATLLTEATADMGMEAITADMAAGATVVIMVVAAATMVGAMVVVVDTAAATAKARLRPG